MRKIDSDGVERFDSRVSVEQLQRANPVLRAIQAGADDEAVLALLRGGGGAAIGNILGGDNMWLADPSNAVGGPPTTEYAIQKFVVPWGDVERKVVGNFDDKTIAVMQFTVPAAPASYASVGYCAMAEWQDPPTGRTMSLSTSPGDFRAPIAIVGGTVPLIYFNVGRPPLLVTDPPSLEPGRTYYFNFKNEGGMPEDGTANASFSTLWPH